MALGLGFWGFGLKVCLFFFGFPLNPAPPTPNHLTALKSKPLQHSLSLSRIRKSGARLCRPKKEKPAANSTN